MKDTLLFITIVTACVIFIGTAAVIWDRAIPDRTPEQEKVLHYYRCVNTQYANGRDISMCNQIK